MDAHQDESLQQRLLRCGSANVADALRALGKHFQSMDGGIRPVWPRATMAGPAFTVRCYPGATFALEQALELAAPGDVLVVDGASAADVILMGGLMSRRASVRGIAGAIVDGAVRDIDDIAAISFPVFSRHICPRAGTFAEIGECQTTIVCGRIPVRDRDYIVADNSGISVIPFEMLEATAAKAMEINAKESAIDSGLQTGLPLSAAAAKAMEQMAALLKN